MVFVPRNSADELFFAMLSPNWEMGGIRICGYLASPSSQTPPLLNAVSYQPSFKPSLPEAIRWVELIKQIGRAGQVRLVRELQYGTVVA
jgi:hypothetical protein